MGFLDMFDSPDIMHSLLGIGRPGISPGADLENAGPSVPPRQPGQMMTAPVPNMSVASANPASGLTGPAPPDAGGNINRTFSTDARAAPAPQPQDSFVATPDYTKPPAGGPPDMAFAGPPGATPMPTPDPRKMQAAAPPPAAPAPAPSPGAAPMPPPAYMTNAPTGQTTGSMPGAFGLVQQSRSPMMAPTPQDNLRATFNGVGKGLSAVAAQPAGSPAGKMFAAGAGGSLEGVTGAQEKQKQDLFNNSSTAFKDMLAAKSSDDTAAYKAAQSKYLAARAQSLQAMTAAGGRGTNAWQNTPYGKVIQVENEAQKYEKGQQIILQKQWGLNGATPEQQQKDLDGLNKKVEAYRTRLYGTAGIDPKQADKIKNMGIEKDNPFDTKGMSVDQFHAQVPMGAWYKTKDKSGNDVILQRTKPPPGAQQSGVMGHMEEAQPGASAAPNYDDLQAMTPAA